MIFTAVMVLIPYLALHYVLLRLDRNLDQKLDKESSALENFSGKNNTSQKNNKSYPFFLYGILGAILVAVPQRIYVQSSLFAHVKTFWQMYLGSALLEELTKWLILRISLRAWLSFPSSPSFSWALVSEHRKLFGCYAAVLGLILGLGFASTENILYMLQFGYTSIYLRGTSVLVHLGLSAFVATSLYAHILASRRCGRPVRILFWRTLFWAVFWHGSYNAAVQFGSPILALGVVLLIVLLVFLVLLSPQIKDP